MALIDKLTAIADAVRGKTGGTDALTLDQIVAEITALEIGSGGGGFAYDMGEFVLDADTTSAGNINYPDVQIAHNLGHVPGFAMIWTDYFADKYDADNVNTEFTSSTNVGVILFDKIAGVSYHRLSSAITREDGMFQLSMTFQANDYRLGIAVPNSLAYALATLDAEKISKLFFSSSSWWRAGITYKYYVSDAWW